MKIIVKILLFFLLIFPICLSGQHEGDQWVLGYGYGNPGNRIMFVDFSLGKATINIYPKIKFYMRETVASICNSEGIPILFTNGMEIAELHTADRDSISKSEVISFESDPLSYWNYWFRDDVQLTSGFPEIDGAIILPVPNQEGVFSIIYHKSEIHPPGYFQVSNILESRVRINEDSSFIVEYKDKLVLPHHKWYTGSIKATRHANGRDWWIIVFKENSPRYYSMLLTQGEIKLIHESEVDSMVLDGVGQAAFSSNGNYLARVDTKTIDVNGQYITLYSFDRCTGELNRINTFQEDGGFLSGVAFSPSEQFLYGGNNLSLWQWDLLANNIKSSKTLVDTFDGFIPPGWFGTTFGPMMNAPDGRIYMIPTTGSSTYFHVIDRPNLPAPDCKFLQHHIELPSTNGRSAPNIPNFRLGPIDGSSCDTLSINNNPVSLWRYGPDNEFYWQTIRFTDLSYFEPENWFWDFGDGNTSTDPNPIHDFEPGQYEVCLIVSNSFSSDTSCQWIEILTTEVKEQLGELPDISIDPNPFNDKLIIKSRTDRHRLADLCLYDFFGRLILSEIEIPVPSTMNVPSLLPGMYYCILTEKDGRISSWKLIKS